MTTLQKLQKSLGVNKRNILSKDIAHISIYVNKHQCAPSPLHLVALETWWALCHHGYHLAIQPMHLLPSDRKEWKVFIFDFFFFNYTLRSTLYSFVLRRTSYLTGEHNQDNFKLASESGTFCPPVHKCTIAMCLMGPSSSMFSVWKIFLFPDDLKLGTYNTILTIIVRIWISHRLIQQAST